MFMHCAHLRVSRGFCEYGCGGNRRDFTIAFDDCRDGPIDHWAMDAVDYNLIGRNAERKHRAAHG